jgi:O-antigen/teichoic acid export membrane protein
MSKPMKKELLKGAGWALAGRFGAALSLLGVHALLARMLTAEDMGMYFLLFSLVSFGAVVAQVGLPKVVVRYIAGALEKNNYQEAKSMVRWAIAGNALGILVLSLLALSPLGLWATSFLIHSNDLQTLLLLSVLWVAALSLLQNLAEVFRGFHDLRLASMFGGAVSGSIALVLILTYSQVYGDANLEQALMLSVIAWGMAVTLSLIFVFRKIKSLPVVRTPESSGRFSAGMIASTAWPLWFSDILLFVLLQVDLWIVGAFCSDTDTALYGAAARLMILVALPLMLVNAVIQPKVAAAHARGEIKNIEPVLRGAASVAGALALVAFILVVLLGDLALGTIYGEFYKQAYWVLVILTMGKLLDVLLGSSGVVLAMAGAQYQLLGITTLSAVSLVVLGCVGGIYFGILGVALAAVAGLLIQKLLMLFSVRRHFGVWSLFSIAAICHFVGRKQKNG